LSEFCEAATAKQMMRDP